MALAEIRLKICLKFFYLYTHILNEYAKKEEEKKKITDWPTFHRVLLTKIYLMLALHT